MNSSARSSVPINLEQLCSPAVITPQEKPTSGFYAGLAEAVSDALSTPSGKCLKLKASPTVVRFRSQLCAEISLRAASTLQFLTCLAQSTLRPTALCSPISPARFCAAPVLGAAFFCEVPA